MSELIVATFETQREAEAVRLELLQLEHAHLVDLEDAAIVVCRPDGKIRLRQNHNLPLAGAISGTFWGTLIGALFLMPVAGAAVGAASGALAGAASDIGVNDEFMRTVGKSLEPGHSALFVLVRSATPDKVVEALRPFGGEIMQTSLSADAEKRLRESLEEAA